jgi:hypothetical protein
MDENSFSPSNYRHEFDFAELTNTQHTFVDNSWIECSANRIKM